jgi:hypothetical protein
MNNQIDVSVQIKRLGTIISPDESASSEAGGMINPASLVDRQGNLLVYPRAVERPNISRMARLQLGVSRPAGQSFLQALSEGVASNHNKDTKTARDNYRAGDDNRAHDNCKTSDTSTPQNGRFSKYVAKRLGNALVPRASFERRQSGGPFGTGFGVEDPRITFMPDLDLWVCCYTAFGPAGPRCAMAYSKNGYTWRRLGLVKFASQLNLNGDDKDGVIFPNLVRSPEGMLSFAYYHRPMHPLDIEGDAGKYQRVLALPPEERDCIRIAYIPAQPVLDQVGLGQTPHGLLDVCESHILLPPLSSWGQLKNGAGTPPVPTPFGYLSFFHGVDARLKDDGSGKYRMLYRAGLIVHDLLEPHKVKYVSPVPVLSPESQEELTGVVDNVVFPTGVTQFTKKGEPSRYIPAEEQEDCIKLLILWGAADFVTNAGLVTVSLQH